jgi:hypothetical protein
MHLALLVLPPRSAMLGPYSIIVTLTALSAFLSALMILFIVSDPKRYRQFYQLLCLLFGLADLIQSSSWWIAFKYQATADICLLQEYMLQGSSLVKATVTIILSTATLGIIYTKQKLNRKQFVCYCLCWMIVPLLCLPLSIASETATLYCHESSSTSRHALAYALTILLPLLLIILFNSAIFLITRHHLLSSIRSHQHQPTHPNPYDLTLLRLIFKLHSYPIVFSLCWLTEIVAVMTHLLSHHSFPLLDYVGVILITLTGPGMTCLYFVYEWNAIGPSVRAWSNYLQRYLSPKNINTSAGLLTSHYTSSVYPPLPHTLASHAPQSQSQSPGDETTLEEGLIAQERATSLEMSPPQHGETNSWVRSSLISAGLFPPSSSFIVPESDLVET